MKSPLRIVVWLAVVAASVAAGFYLSATPNNGVPVPSTSAGRYVFIAGGADPYWELCVAGAREAADRLGAEVTVQTPTGEGEPGLKEQLGWIGEIDADQVDGLAIGPIDPKRQTTLINSLAEKTTVVTVDSDAPESRRMFYVGSSNYEAGQIAARLAAEALPDGGEVALLVASFAKTNAAERRQGFVDALGEQGNPSRLRLVETYLDEGDYDTCRENVRKALEEHPDLGAVVCTFGYHGGLALETLAGIEGGSEVELIAFDEAPSVLDGIREGRVHATIAQDPFMFGFEAIRMLDEVRSGRYLSLPIAGRVDVGVHCIPVTKDNLEDFRSRLSERLGDKAPAEDEG